MKLNDREGRVWIMRYGLDGDAGRTLEDTGQGLHITRERVRAIQAKAIRKLRQPQLRSKLHDFAAA